MKNRRGSIVMGNWNVQTMRASGKLEMVEKEMTRNGIDCLGLSEVRWKEKGHFVTQEGSTVIYSGSDTHHKNGVAVMLTAKTAKCLLGYNTISDRILTVRLSGKVQNVTFIQVYGPTNQASDYEKTQFYHKLQAVFNEVPKQDLAIVSGDFNAKIGKGAPIGPHAMGQRNDNGDRLVQFALCNGLAAANARHAVHPRRQYTWKSPDGIHRNQIDYFLVPERWVTGVGKCKTFPGADVGSDHMLLRLRFKTKLARRTEKKPAPCYDLKDTAGYRLELANRFALLQVEDFASDKVEEHSSDRNQETESDKQWSRLKNAVESAAKATLPKQSRIARQSWITDETFERIEEKRGTPRSSEKYRALKRTVRRMLRRDRKMYLESMCEEIEQHQRRNETKAMHEKINGLIKHKNPTLRLIKSEKGETLTETPDILDRWRSYCDELYKGPTNIESPQNNLEEVEKEPPPTYEEVEKAMKDTHNGKAVGPDGIPIELLKAGGDTVTQAMHSIILTVWRTGQWPKDWAQSTFVPLHKKGDPAECANYRTISLISHASKVLLKVILARIQNTVESEVAEEQAGFRPQKGTRNHLCNLRIITEKARSRKQPLYLCFVDFQKAFDTVSHKKLWKAMADMGFSKHIITVVRSLYENQESNVRMHGTYSKSFTAKRGVRQGCILSPYLFNILAELVMRIALDGYDGGFRIGGRQINNLRYADDIVLIATSEQGLQELVERVNRAAQQNGLKVNVKKTEVMAISDTQNQTKVVIDGQVLATTDSFKYLGGRYLSQATSDTEVKEKLATARARLTALQPLWKSNQISKPLKAKIIRCLIWPVLTSGCEAWTLNKELRENIEAFEMQCYRRALRISYTEHVTNEAVLNEMGTRRFLLGNVKARKLKYFGHITRHPGLEKDIMLGMVPGTRRQGGQRKQWADDLTEWTDLSLSELVRLAEDREAYRRFVHKVAYGRSTARA
jgi:hypothetical protein